MNNLENALLKLKSIENKLLEKHYNDEEHYDLVLSLGISKDEFSALKKSYKYFLRKGQYNLKMNLPTDALADFKTVQLISPYEFDVNLGLTMTFALLWEQTGTDKNKELAFKFAVRSQEMDLNDDIASAVINQINNNRTKNGIQRIILQKFKKDNRNLVRNILIFLVAIFGFLMYSIFYYSQH